MSESAVVVIILSLSLHISIAKLMLHTNAMFSMSNIYVFSRVLSRSTLVLMSRYKIFYILKNIAVDLTLLVLNVILIMLIMM